MNIDSPKAPPHPWYRLHLSTWLVLLLASGVLVLLNVPGEESPRIDPVAFNELGQWDEGFRTLSHGFPLAYLWRSAACDPNPKYGYVGAPGGLGTWELTDRVLQFRPWALLADLILAAIALIVFARLCEWRRRKRKPWQFSLAELLLAATAVAAVFGWLVAERKQYHETIQHFIALETKIPGPNRSSGYTVDGSGFLARNAPIPKGQIAAYMTPWPSRWLRDLVGDEPLLGLGLGRPRMCEISWDRESREHLKDFKYLFAHYPNELMLELGGGETDDELSAIDELKELQHLTIQGAGNHILARISHLPNLQTLVLDSGRSWAHAVWDPWAGSETARGGQYRYWDLWPFYSNVSDEGLAQVGKLTDLVALQLAATNCTDRGLAHLGSLKSLEMLALRGGRFTDEGLRNLAGMQRLQILSLAAVPITDAGLAQLSELNSLEELYIEGSLVTDRGLQRLKGLPRLRVLDVTDTEVSAAGIAMLKQARPSLYVNDGTADGAAEDLNQLQIAEKGPPDDPKFGPFTNLEIWSPKLDDSNMANLGRCSEIRQLTLASRRITDVTMARVGAMNNLGLLNVAGSRITSRGLKNLVGLKELDEFVLDIAQLGEPTIETLKQMKELNLIVIEGADDSAASQRLMAKLRAALPDCRVEPQLQPDATK